MMDTPLLVNIKGCGYPPEVDCAAFAIKYQVKLMNKVANRRAALDESFLLFTLHFWAK